MRRRPQLRTARRPDPPRGGEAAPLDAPEMTELADGRTLRRLTALLLEELGRTPMWHVRRFRRLSEAIEVVREVERETRRREVLRHDTTTRRPLL